MRYIRQQIMRADHQIEIDDGIVDLPYLFFAFIVSQQFHFVENKYIVNNNIIIVIIDYFSEAKYVITEDCLLFPSSARVLS